MKSTGTNTNTTMLLLGLLALAVPTAGSAAEKGTRIELTVTEAGFEPSPVKVKEGEPVTLVITRKTDNTCAKSVVIDAADVKGGERISRKLPLNEAVQLTFVPAHSGQILYGCSMNKMVGGVLQVQGSGKTSSQTDVSPPGSAAQARSSSADRAPGCCGMKHGVGSGMGGMVDHEHRD
jgi:plastocyanin domain-containing protein